MVNFVYQPTRVCSRFHKRRNQYLQSESVIDLFLHNADLVDETSVIDCPFSDHKFVLAKLTVAKLKCKQKTILCRNLSLVNTENICSQIDEIDWSGFKNFSSIDEKWMFVKEKLIKIIENTATVRKISINMSSQFPWYDDDLICLKHSRDIF